MKLLREKSMILLSTESQVKSGKLKVQSLTYSIQNQRG